MSVPLHLHQVWVGPKPLPAREAQWVRQMAVMNPRWKHVLHTNDMLDRYRAEDPYLRELIDRGEPWAYVSDRLRALILRDQGGVYLDADCKPVRSLDTLTDLWTSPHVTFVSAFRDPHKEGIALSRGISLVDNTFIASAPKSRMIEALCRIWTPRSIAIHGNFCGKSFMSESGPDCVWLNFRYIYADREWPETLVLHDGHNLASWVAQERAKHTAAPINIHRPALLT